MAKKKIDLWGDTNTYRQEEPAVSSDSSLLLGKKSKKGNDPIIGHSPELPNATQEERNLIRERRSLKNPLTIVEGKSEVVTDVSTAVSAALAKAIQDDYEVERLGEILDVVIDEVDDPDLTNESLRRKNFGILPLFLVIGSVVLAVILIPLVLLLGYSIGKVDDLTSARELMGYKTDAEAGEETHFSIQHLDSGKYLSPPIDQAGNIIYNAPLTLTDTSPYEVGGDFVNDLYFHASSTNGDEIQINYDSYSIVNDNGEVKWMESFEAQSGIYLVKSTNEQKFSIGFENTNKFLAYDKKSDSLELSNNPDYFRFDADVSFIEDADSYLSDYAFLNSGTDGYVSNLDLGINGNALSLYSTKTNKNLSAYKEVDYHNLPFIEISENEFEDALTLSNEMNYDFFLNPVSVGGPETSLSIGSFQTTKFDWTKIPWGNGGTPINLDPSEKTQFPLITAKNGKVTLEQYSNSYQTGETMPDGTVINRPLEEYPWTTIYLLPDPTNLKNKAIYFTEADAFLSTEGGIHLQTISSEAEITDLDFFQFTFSESRNPENIHTTVGSLTENSGDFTLYANNYSSLKGWEISLLGYSNESVYEMKQELVKIFADASLTTEEQQEAVMDLLNKSTTDSYYQKEATKRNVEAVKLNNLNFNTWYIGTANVYRDLNKGTGPHMTSVPVIFKTADAKGNVSNWGDGNTIDIEEPDTGNPTSTGTTPSVVTELVETTWIENPGSVNNESFSESVNDLLADDMRTMGATSLEVTTTLTNGKITSAKSGVTTGIRITLLDEDEDEVEQQEITTSDVIWGLEDGDYTFLFKDLEVETNYKAKIEVQDIAGDWYVPMQTTNNTTEQELVDLTTERLLPPLVTRKVETTYNSRGEANQIAIDELENFGTADTLNFKFTSKTDGTRFETGYRPLSSFENGVDAGGKLTVELQPLLVSGGYALGIGGNPTMVGEEFTFELLLKVGPTDYEDWPDESPLWYDGEQGQIKILDGTVKQA